MLDSQVLETAIGLALLFFLLAFAASQIVELISRRMKKRAVDLERTIAAMFKGHRVDDTELAGALEEFKRTSIYKSLHAAAGRSFLGGARKPSYISAKAFADGVTEMLAHDGALDDIPAGLRKRLEPLAREGHAELLAIKAGLETWFDETMQRLEGAYKRWATTVLFAVGLLLAVATNASTVDVAQKLWHDPVTRQAVAASAQNVLQDGAPAAELDTVAETTATIKELSLPVGWKEGELDAWKAPGLTQLYTALGWLLTALLVMLGAPFWFDLLTRLSSLRGAGSKPPPAAEDASSATATVMAVDPPGYGFGAQAAAADTPLEDALRAALRLPPPSS